MCATKMDLAKLILVTLVLKRLSECYLLANKDECPSKLNPADSESTPVAPKGILLISE